MFSTPAPYTKRNSLLKYFFSTALLIIVFSNAIAQKTIKGKITNEKGEPVPFATVVIKGSKTATQSNPDGEFKLQHMQPETIILVCSAVGYQSIEKKISKKILKDSVINITIKTAESRLDEVVVVGYSSTKRKSVTGSVAAVSSTGIMRSGDASSFYATAPASSASRDKTLLGKVAGVAVTEGKELAKTAMPVDAKQKDIKRTKLLTAGEVNDFKKWKMWEDYNESDFRSYSERWELFATQRYSIQVQNNDFKAITGIKVFLINRVNGDTLWAAVTDNTGKAELWNGFIKNTKDNDLVIAVENENSKYPAIPFVQGINRIVVNRSCAVSNKVEIAFVVDATGSMQDEIVYLKEELEDILTKVAQKDASIDLHTGAVFYRDRTDAYVTKLQQFTAGIKNTVDFIRQQNADGGGDYPEALKEALQDATDKLTWSEDARTKIIFLLMDAPPHDEAKKEMITLIANTAAKGIRIVPLACSGTDKSTEFIMRSMALATNGTYLFLTDDSGIGNSHIKPTTDEFKVELLNDLLQRVIEQMCYVNTCAVTTKGIEPLTVYPNVENVKVYPNPSNGPVTLETAKELKEIFVADFTGKLLLRINVKDKKGKYSIDLSALPSATYFIRYITKEGVAGAEKVVVVR